MLKEIFEINIKVSSEISIVNEKLNETIIIKTPIFKDF